MSDRLAAAAQVWADMQGDPTMLSGVTIGQANALIEGVGELLGLPEIQAIFPVALAIKMENAEEGGFSATMDLLTEIVSLRKVREILNREAGLGTVPS